MDIDYKTVVFIDSNVALECLGLDQLPWSEIDRSGPVLVLITPTVLREVDSKKNDGRLGDHARRFNNFLRPLLGQKETVTVRDSPEPRVDLGLASCSPIDWVSFPNLDQSEPDACIIAEALHSKLPRSAEVVVVSQDIRPLDLARQHDLKIHHVSEQWLRPKQMTAAERKAASLEREVAALKSSQPELIIEWDNVESPVEVLRVKSLSIDERQDILNKIRRKKPKPNQERQFGYDILLNDHNYDPTLDARYDRWSNHLLPRFVDQLDAKMELVYNQIELTIKLKNTGQVRADSVLLELIVNGGWVNSKPIYVNPEGPPAPTPTSQLFNQYGLPDIPGLHNLTLRPGKHDVVVEEEPKRSTFVKIECEDFRHGADYPYEFVAWLDPHSKEPLKIDVVVTAANLHGAVTSSVTLQKRISVVNLEELIDLNDLKYCRNNLIYEKIYQVNEADLSDIFDIDSDV